MRTKTRLQANFTEHKRAEFIEVSVRFLRKKCDSSRDESGPWLSFVLVSGHFVATVCMLAELNVFDTG